MNPSKVIIKFKVQTDAKAQFVHRRVENAKLQREIRMVIKLMKRRSTSFAIRERQNHVRHHHPSIRMVQIKNNDNTKIWRECEKTDHSYIAGGKVR